MLPPRFASKEDRWCVLAYVFWQMPIEDVQHLLRNSVHDCATIFVDSSKRDYVHYPTPSEYVVDLLEPVKNVYGIDVLDAAIANCMYNVDYNNCHARIIGLNTDLCTALQTARSVVVATSTTTLSAEATDEMWDQADLSALNSEFFALGFASPLRGWLADVTRASYRVCVLDLSNAAANASLMTTSSSIELAADVEAYGNMFCYALVETRVSGIPMLCTTSSYAPSSKGGIGWVAFNGAYYLPSQPIAEALAAPGGYAIEPNVALGGYDVVTYAVTQLTTAVYSTLSGVASTLLQFSIGTAAIETGNYLGGGMLMSSAQEAFSATSVANSISINATSQSGIGKRSILRFDADRNYRFMISTVDSSAASVLGFDLETNQAINLLPRSDRTFGAVQVGGHPVPLYCSVLRPLNQELDAPGLMNLLGVRYIALRCPEIEQYICTTGKYGPFSVGVGVFKLASTNEVGQVRFDYVSLVHKPFHPIGKLQRVTLRFELPDGTLYDFKGINNQLLLSLKYYTPTPAEARPGGGAVGDAVVSQLNPDYDPDFLSYMVRQTGFAPRLQDAGYDPYDEYDESENDDEEDDDDDTRSGSDQDGDPGYEDSAHAVALRRFDDDVQRRVLARERGAFERSGNN